MSLEQRMKDVLAEASLIAEASAAGLSERTSSGKADSREPTIGGPSTFDQIARRFEGCKTDAQRQRAVTWAEQLVRSVKTRTGSLSMGVDEAEFWATHAIENGAGKDYRTVARETGLSEKTIWAIRKRAKVDPRYGTKAA